MMHSNRWGACGWPRWVVLVLALGCSTENPSFAVKGRTLKSANGRRDSAFFPEASASGIAAIWANNGEDKVTQHELRASRDNLDVRNSVWNGKQIQLFAGRNEIVACNLVLECPGPAKSLPIDLEVSTLRNDAGDEIPGWTFASKAQQKQLFDFRGKLVEPFFVRYLQIKGCSVLAYEHYDERHVPQRLRRPYRGAGNAKGGWTDRPDHDQFYPDIAVPLELHVPFQIAAGRNQSIWIDIYVPSTMAVGIYRGTVSIGWRDTSDGNADKVSSNDRLQVPIELKVRSYTLPEVPHAKTMIYLSDENVNRRYLGEPYPEPETANGRRSAQIVDQHFKVAHRHKLSLIDDYKPIELVDSVWRERLDGTLFTPSRGYDGPGIGQGNGVYSIGSYGSWPWKEADRAAMWRHTDEWFSWFARQDFAATTDIFLYLIDESDDFPLIEKWSQWVDSNPGPGKQLATLATLRAPDAMQHTPSLDIATSAMMAGDTGAWRQATRHYLQRGPKHLILYNGWRPGSGCFATEDDGVALRQLGWCQHKMSIRRWFAWESTYYNNFQGDTGQTDVFEQAQVFGGRSKTDPSLGVTGWNYNNGDGVLFYPGTDKLFPKNSYNVSGPFASLRLKHWRRGIQDADYLTMAARKQPEAVQRIVARMVPKVLWELGVSDKSDPSWVTADISWSTNPDDWEAARSALADIIEQ